VVAHERGSVNETPSLRADAAYPMSLVVWLSRPQSMVTCIWTETGRARRFNRVPRWDYQPTVKVDGERFSLLRSITVEEQPKFEVTWTYEEMRLKQSMKLKAVPPIHNRVLSARWRADDLPQPLRRRVRSTLLCLSRSSVEQGVRFNSKSATPELFERIWLVTP